MKLDNIKITLNLIIKDTGNMLMSNLEPKVIMCNSKGYENIIEAARYIQGFNIATDIDSKCKYIVQILKYNGLKMYIIKDPSWDKEIEVLAGFPN